VNGIRGFNLIKETSLVYRWFQNRRKHWSWGELPQNKEKNLVLAFGSTQQYSRHKYMPLRHVQLRI
jgi:hypothetical protein